MRSRAINSVLVALALSALVSCASDTEVVFQDGSAPEHLGTVGFQLQLESGLIFQQVTLTLKTPDGRTQTQTIDVSPEDSTVSAYLGELAVGGYEVTLASTSTTGVPCAGSTGFVVKADETVVVMVRMECGGGVADPVVGAARVKAEIIPNEGECPAVIDRLVVAPSRAGIGVPVSVEVFPVAGTPPIVTFSADDGMLTANGARATFRCTSAGEVTISVQASRAGCEHAAEATVKCFDDGTPFVPAGGGGAGGSGMMGGGGMGMGMGMGMGGAGMGMGMGGAGMGANTCQTCTASNCATQLTSCQSEPTSAACQENRTCSNVGTSASCAAGSSLACYCGTRPTATCLTSGGIGSCADVITRTSGCLDGRPADEVPLCIAEHFLDIGYGLGDAYQLVACQRRNCPTQCALTR